VEARVMARVAEARGIQAAADRRGAEARNHDENACDSAGGCAATDGSRREVVSEARAILRGRG